MRKKIPLVFYILGVALVLISAWFVHRWTSDRQITRQIPEITSTQALPAAVASQIEEAMLRVKRNPNSHKLGKLAMVFHSSAMYEEAALCYHLASDQDSEQWTWEYFLGFLHLEMGKSQLAIESFSKVLQLDPSNHLAVYYSGKAYANLGDMVSAERCFSQIPLEERSGLENNAAGRTDYFPLQTYARFQLARIYLQSERLELAENTLLEIIQGNRLFGQAYRLLGNVYRSQGDELRGDYYTVCAMELMNVSEPVDVLIDQLSLISRSELYILKRIDEATRNFHSEWALEMVDHGIQYLSDNKHMVTKAMELWLGAGQVERASDFSKSHFALFADDYNDAFEIGMMLFTEGLFEEAIPYFSRLGELKPEVLDNYKKLGICHWYLGKRQEALEIIYRVVERHPGNLNVLAYYTDILVFDLGVIDAAAEPFGILMENAPELARVQKIAGRFAEQKGEMQKAIALYEAAFREDPEDEITITLLGNILLRQKMWSASIRHYRSALDHHPNNPGFLERLGTLLVMSPDATLRNIAEGLQFSERAFSHVAGDASIKVRAGKSLSLAYAMLGQKEMALSILEGVLDIARYEKLPDTEMSELGKLSAQIEALEDKAVLPNE